jgi:hypothetical protein
MLCVARAAVFLGVVILPCMADSLLSPRYLLRAHAVLFTGALFTASLFLCVLKLDLNIILSSRYLPLAHAFLFTGIT